MPPLTEDHLRGAAIEQNSDAVPKAEMLPSPRLSVVERLLCPTAANPYAVFLKNNSVNLFSGTLPAGLLPHTMQISRLQRP